MAKYSFIVRESTVKDADGIAYAHMRTWQTAYAGIVPEAYLGSLDLKERAIRQRQLLSDPQNSRRYFVAETDQGEIAGFACAGESRDGGTDFQGELYAIYVLKEHAGHGIGRELFKRVVVLLREMKFSSMKVWVLKDNPSRKFYEAMGGKLLKEVKPDEIGGVRLEEVSYGWAALPG